jgi:hypothetical protein
MQDRNQCGRRSVRYIAGWIVLFCLAFPAASAAAADIGRYVEIGKFQVVPGQGSDDKAYLVDTVTGAVWVLTYRTMATGREPIAIPYKFIRNTPKNQGEFLIESMGPNTSMPYGVQGK